MNRAVKVAKQSRIAVRSRRTGQIADDVILSVEYARKRTTHFRPVLIECADGRPVGVYRQIDVVRQQIGFAALAVARVHLVGELFELLSRGDVNRSLTSEHPAGQFAALFALHDLQNRQAVFGVRPRVVICKNLGELLGERAAVVDQVCAVFIVRRAVGHGVSVHLHAAPRVNVQFSIRLGQHSMAGCSCHGLPQRHASLYVPCLADDTSAIPSADISCRIAAPDARPNKVTSDNSACIRVRCDDLARRIAILKRAFLHIADQTAHRTGSLYSSANHGAFFNACARIALTADKRANLASPLNLRIANHNVPNGRKMCIAKQACIILTSGNCQADDRMPLPVEHAGKRLIIAVVPIDIIANRHPVQPGKIDIVHQQKRLAAHVDTAVDRRSQIGQIRRGIDVDRVRAAVFPHPCGNFA